MTRGDTRLWRKLGATAELFTVTAHQTWDDDTLVSWTGTRGASTSGPGVLTGTATVTVKGEVPTSDDQPISIRLTDHAITLLGLDPTVDGPTHAPRWYGRIGSQEVTDAPGGRSTQLECADWFAEIARADLKYTAPAARPYLPDIVRGIYSAANLPAGVPTTWEQDFLTTVYVQSTVGAGGTVPWSDVADVYTATAGNIVLARRDGTPHLSNLTAKETGESLDWAGTYADQALLRWHCKSPAKWEQPTSSPAVVKYDNGSGTQTIRAGSGTRPIRERVSTTDKLYLNPADTEATPRHTLDLSMTGLAYRLGGLGYQVSEVTVDLLRLFTNGRPEDRTRAQRLLLLEPFDHVPLAYDWPPEVAGLYYAQQITESVTPDAWTLTIGLAPTRQITGNASPAVAGTTWDSVYPATTTWDTPPTTTTWDNAPE